MIISLLMHFAEIMLKNKHFGVRNKQGKGKVHLNSACCDIEIYATTWKQAPWSTSIDMPQHGIWMSWHPKDSKDDQTLICHDIEAKKKSTLNTSMLRHHYSYVATSREILDFFKPLFSCNVATLDYTK